MIGRIVIRSSVCAAKTFLQQSSSTWLLFPSAFSQPAFLSFSRLLYHTSRITNAKAKKSNAKEASGASDFTVELPNLQAFQLSIAKPVTWLTAEFAKAKLGQVTPEYFASLMVPSLGALGKLAQVSIKPGGTISIAVFDPSTIAAIVDAVKDCGLNLNPAVDGNNIVAKVPRPSKETREAMIKSLSKLSDKIKQDVRNIRKDVMEKAKKCKGSLSEDDIKRHAKEIESLTERSLDTISNMLKAKEKELLSSS